MKEDNKNTSRRKFIQQSAVLGASVMLADSSQLFAANKNKKTIEQKKIQGKMHITIKTRLVIWKILVENLGVHVWPCE